MLLSKKNAVIYGGGGSIGRRVAAAFAREGARVHLCGRNAKPIEAVAEQIRASGGAASVNVVDANDPDAVAAHLDKVEKEHGFVDVAFNLIGVQDSQGTPLIEMPLKAYLEPISIGTQAHFVTATENARRMVRRGKGVILSLTATPSRLALPLVGGFGAYCAAIEGFYRTLAAEIGEKGVRVCWLRSAGSPETFGPDVASGAGGEAAGLADSSYLESMRRATLLRRFPKAEEVANAAALVASDGASAMTAAAVNVTCGQIVD